MKLKTIIESIVKDVLKEERMKVNKNDLPNILYHVTTNYNKVISSGVLLAKSGLGSGGLGGTESTGVSFVTSKDIAINIFNELNLINDINNSNNKEDVLNVLNTIEDEERKIFVINEFNRTVNNNLYDNFFDSALMALRLSRISLNFFNKPFHGLVIFREENIKNKDIGIISINKNNIPNDVDIIEGVDKNLGEIRVLGNVPLK